MQRRLIQKNRRRTGFQLKPTAGFLEDADAVSWSKAVEVLIVRPGFNYEDDV